MGNLESDNESKYIEIVYENYTTKQIEYYAKFEKTPFAEGSFRYAYRGQIKDRFGRDSRPYYFPNGKCTIKVSKRGYAKNVRSYKEDLKNIFYSSSLSKKFNTQYTNLTREIRFIQPYIAKLDKYGTDSVFWFFSQENHDSMEKIGRDEYLFIEPYLEGYYEKYVNNNMEGIENLNEIISFFMHWNWNYSKGKKLVADIQGVQKRYYYELTDPAVQSIGQEFGSTDLGVFSLYVFISKHKHNKYCRYLPWPKDDLVRKINSEINTTIVDYKLGILNITNLTQFYRDEVLEPVFHEKIKTELIIFFIMIILYKVTIEIGGCILKHKNMLLIIIIIFIIIIFYNQ